MSEETTNGRAESTGAVDRMLDLAVYAPLGLLLDSRRAIPELAAAGRRQVEFSRSLGRAALRTLSKQAAARAGTARSSATAPTEADGVGGSVNRDRHPDQGPGRSNGEIGGYETLNAREVIALISAATPAQVEWMLDTEHAGKARKTVLEALGRRAATVHAP